MRPPGAGRSAALAYATKGAGAGGGISADTYAQAAKGAWVAPLIAFGLGCCTRGVQRASPGVGATIGIFQIVLIVAGVGLGIFALVGVRKHGGSGILFPAIAGLVLNALFIGLIVVLAMMLMTGRLPVGAGGGGVAPPAPTVPVTPNPR